MRGCLGDYEKHDTLMQQYFYNLPFNSEVERGPGTMSKEFLTTNALKSFQKRARAAIPVRGINMDVLSDMRIVMNMVSKNFEGLYILTSRVSRQHITLRSS